MPRPPPAVKPKPNAKPLQTKHQTASSSPLPSPSQSPSPSPELIEQTRASLADVLAILKAFAHRHHNQHRSSHWWRSFGLLRRAARSLAASLLRPPPPSLSSRRPRHDAPVPVHARWISSRIVPGAYLAFTQLAADNQYAALGLLLLAVLAHVNRLVSDLVPSDHPAPGADPSAARPVNQTTSTSRSTPLSSSSAPTVTDQGDDMGVAVSRRDHTLSKQQSKQPDPLVIVESQPKDAKTRDLDKPSSKDVTKRTSKDPREKKKKKKKPGDAFSSLFGSI